MTVQYSVSFTPDVTGAHVFKVSPFMVASLRVLVG